MSKIFFICYEALEDIPPKYFDDLAIPDCIIDCICSKRAACSKLSLEAGDYIIQICIENNEIIDAEIGGILFHRLDDPSLPLEEEFDFSSSPNLASTCIIHHDFGDEILKFDHRMARELERRDDLFCYYNTFETFYDD